MYEIWKKGTNEPICKAGIENGLWTHLGKERVGGTERVALKYIHYHVQGIANGKIDS